MTDILHVKDETMNKKRGKAKGGATRIAPAKAKQIVRLAAEEGRSYMNMVDRLLQEALATHQTAKVRVERA